MKRLLLPVLSLLVLVGMALVPEGAAAARRIPPKKVKTTTSSTTSTTTTSTTAATTTTTAAPSATESGPTPAPADAGVITRAGSQLLLDGAPYRFTGVNAFQLATFWSVNAGCGQQASDTDLDALFGGLRPNSVVRFWAFQSLATNRLSGAEDFTGLDRVVAAAERHQQRLILTLGNHWSECDGPAKPTEWYAGGYQVATPGARTSYLEHVRAVVGRYRSSPAVGFWEPVNEPEVACGATAELRGFFDAVGAEIRSLDPVHLISSGTIGSGQCGTSGADFEYVHASPGIDIANYHDYGFDTVALPGDQWNGLAVRIAQAERLQKPLIVGEVGIEAGDGCATSRAQRRDLLAAKFDAQFGAGVRGILPWVWTTNTPSCTHDLRPDDPALALVHDYPL